VKFVQLVEFSTSQVDELRKLSDEVPRPAGATIKGMVCGDRDNPGRFVVVAEFPSYEEAMENSQRPEVGEFAKRMADLCDGPPTYRNLDVLQEIES
jgi:quinol monooxygenase YgiN